MSRHAVELIGFLFYFTVTAGPIRLGVQPPLSDPTRAKLAHSDQDWSLESVHNASSSAGPICYVWHLTSKAPQLPLDPDLPSNTTSYSTLFKLIFLHRLLWHDVWHLFSWTMHNGHRYDTVSPIYQLLPLPLPSSPPPTLPPSPEDCYQARV